MSRKQKKIGNLGNRDITTICIKYKDAPDIIDEINKIAKKDDRSAHWVFKNAARIGLGLPRP